MIGRLLGHTQVQTTARYAHMMAEPMTQAASEVTNTLGNLMNMRPFVPEPPPPEDANIITGTRVAAPTFLTSDQAATYLGVDQRLMENWRWRKIGPRFVKVGNRIRYDLVDLKEFVRAEI